MKRILLLSFLLVGCGKIYYQNGTGSLGQEMNLVSSPLTAGDKATLTQVCQVMGQKSAALSGLIGTNYVFTFSQKNCNDKEMAPPFDVGVMIQRPYSNFIFKRVIDNQDFYYSDVETNTTGVMGQVCPNVGSLSTNTLALPSGNSLVVTVNPSLGDCSSSTFEKCVMVETLIPSTTSQGLWRTVTRDIMKIKTDPTRSLYGFYSERHSWSSVTCDYNKVVETKVVLK